MTRQTINEVENVYEHEEYLLYKLSEFVEIADVDFDSIQEFINFLIRDAD